MPGVFQDTVPGGLQCRRRARDDLDVFGIRHRRAPAVARDKHSQDGVPTSTAPVIRIPARLHNFEPPDLGTVLITVHNSRYRVHPATRLPPEKDTRALHKASTALQQP
jgi:hypothetical protein